MFNEVCLGPVAAAEPMCGGTGGGWGRRHDCWAVAILFPPMTSIDDLSLRTWGSFGDEQKQSAPKICAAGNQHHYRSEQTRRLSSTSRRRSYWSYGVQAERHLHGDINVSMC